jgi:hypothetical protein
VETYIKVCIHILMYLYIYVRMYVCVYIFMCVNITPYPLYRRRVGPVGTGCPHPLILTTLLISNLILPTCYPPLHINPSPFSLYNRKSNVSLNVWDKLADKNAYVIPLFDDVLMISKSICCCRIIELP